MSLERIRIVAQQLANEREQFAKRRKDRDAAKAAEERFRLAWYQAYPVKLQKNKDEFITVASQNLISLGPAIKERYWDFALSESLFKHEDIADDFAFAAEILIYASFNNLEKVDGYLREGWFLMPSVADAHNAYFTVLSQRSAEGIPFTPPVTQTDLARFLERPRYEINNAFRANKWVFRSNCVSGLQRKHWKHVEAETQKLLIQKIREKNPEILLRNFDDRNGVFA